MPKNKYSILALLWFVASWYALLREGTPHLPPPFTLQDKIGHFAMFFAQIWLFARAWIEAQRQPPYRVLFIFAIVFAITSEWAQWWFTQFRRADWQDGVADILGAIVALLLARNLANHRLKTSN